MKWVELCRSQRGFNGTVGVIQSMAEGKNRRICSGRMALTPNQSQPMFEKLGWVSVLMDAALVSRVPNKWIAVHNLWWCQSNAQQISLCTITQTHLSNIRGQAERMYDFIA